MVPNVVAEHLEEGRFKHPGRGAEEPVGGVDHIQVLLMIKLPDLRHEWLVRSYESGEIPLEGSDDHGVG